MKTLVPTFIALILAGLAHAESAFTVKQADLQAQAQSDAPTLALLPENTKVDVLRRLGAWDEVKISTGQTGWVRMLNLRFDTKAQGGSASGSLNALTGLLSSGRTSNSATVTTGVRGLTEEDLKNAKANPAELEKMQKYAADKTAAQGFAQRSKLASIKLDYLPESAAAAAPANSDEPR